MEVRPVAELGTDRLGDPVARHQLDDTLGEPLEHLRLLVEIEFELLGGFTRHWAPSFIHRTSIAEVPKTSNFLRKKPLRLITSIL